MPILLNAAAGSLVFANVRRIAGGAVALITFLLWVSAPGTFWYRASYLSENTTSVLWLLALWELQEWLEKGGRLRVLVLALCLGLGAITRPMTMGLLALPIAFVFLRRVVARRSWHDLALAVVAGGFWLFVLPLWAAQTTGDWRISPYRHYSRVYFPYDWTGFGVRPDPPLRPLPDALKPFAAHFLRLHTEFTVPAVPDSALRRWYTMGQEQWGGWRNGLRPFAIVGAMAFGAQAGFALVSAAVLFVGHLSFAHNPAWCPYYLEIQPVLSFATAMGLCGVLASIVRPWPVHGRGDERVRRVVTWFLLGAGALAVAGAAGLMDARSRRRSDLADQARFEKRLEALPAPAIVFVHYDPVRGVKGGLVRNPVDLNAARVWIVHDLGPRNAELMRLAPDRRLYLYDDARETMQELPRP
jgi:4-amino-4-deoxy-L-arabinose transferase-like glycosyltransferase